MSATFTHLILQERNAEILFSEPANSLVVRILPLTPLHSRFWQIGPIPGLRNPNQSKILQLQKKKNLRDTFPTLLPENVPVCPRCPLWFIFSILLRSL